jgi:peptide deformylase
MTTHVPWRYCDVYRDPGARLVATPFSWSGERSALFDTMIEAMGMANAVSMSAPLLGIPYRAIVALDEKGKLFEVANPELELKTTAGTFIPLPPPSPDVPKEHIPFIFSEPCPALCMRTGRPIGCQVSRPAIVRVRGMDRHGKPLERVLHQQLARLVQHQLDHLNGVTLLERVYDLTAAHLRKVLGQ